MAGPRRSAGMAPTPLPTTRPWSREAGGYPITYGLRWEGDNLHLQVLKDAHPEAFDLVAQVALYESMPFTAVP